MKLASTATDECKRKSYGSNNETFSPPARSRLKTEVAPVNLCK